MPWRGPSYKGEFPSLGFDVLDWMEAYLAAPDRPEYEPFVPTQEQAEFIIRFYRLDPRTGKRIIRRAALSRPKGWGKSPILSALALAEALAPVVPAGWDEAGDPVGQPWSDVRTPLVQLAAVSEDQTANSWTPLLEMAREGPVLDDYGIEPLDTFVNLPRGKIEPVTSAPKSREGNRACFVVLDQTEVWLPTIGGPKLAAVLRRNAGKIGGSTVESPNAFVPGEGSVAEATAAYAKRIQEGRVREPGLLYDHREAPPDTDFAEPKSLRAGLEYAYGDSARIKSCRIHTPPCPAPGWVDIDRIMSEVWDPDTDPQDARRYYGNQITHASDAWLSAPELASRIDPREVKRIEPVALGFDGSKRRSRGVVDATALIGTTVADGYQFEIRIWEQPPGPAGQGWEIPVLEVDRTVRDTFRRYNVVAFYADPAKWETYVASWEADFGKGLKSRSSVTHPIEWWMTGGRASKTVQALDEYHTAIVDGIMTYDGASTFTRHLLNARRRWSRSGMQIAKEHPESPNKIDGAAAGMLSWKARLDAVAKGLGKKTNRVPARIR